MIRPHAASLLLAAIILVSSACSACEDRFSPVAVPSPTITLSGRFQTKTLTLEIADETTEHAKGLSDRASLASDAGMLFIFPYESERPFWMHNTHFPLDIIFLDSEKRIVGIVRRARPDSDEQLTVGKPCRYVLEIEGGLADRIGIREGDILPIN